MTIGPAHEYILEGINQGIDRFKLEKISSSADELKKQNLPYINSLRHLSHYTGVDYRYLRSVVKRQTHEAYQKYKIKKRSGGYRTINAPEEALKTVQIWINKNILYNLSPHWRCFSFHRNASIKNCAYEHCRSRWLIKIDIERFFESISEFDVYKLFISLGYSNLVSFELARICTLSPTVISKPYIHRWVMYNRKDEELPYSRRNVKFIGHLPQGAPTSPQISNLVFLDLDEIFYNKACQFGMVYTRYADDIAFSSNTKNFSREDAQRLVLFVNKILQDRRYNPNHNKLKIIPPGARKVLLGLNIDSS